MPKKSKNTKQKTSEKTIKGKRREGESIFSFLDKCFHSEQFPRIMGVGLLLFAVFCFISFVSFFVTWFKDYSLVENITPYSLLTKADDINNWCGNIGAFVAYVFIRYTFGFGAFGFLILFVLGFLGLFDIPIKKLSKWIVATLVFMLWVSCIFGFIVVACGVEKMEDFAGIVGIGINQLWCSYISVVGCVLVHLAFSLTIPILLFNVKYSKLLKTNRENSVKAEKNKSKHFFNGDIIPAEKMNLERGYRETKEEKEEENEKNTNQTLEDFNKKDWEINTNPDNLTPEQEKEVTTFVIKRNGETITIDDSEQEENKTETKEEDIPFRVKAAGEEQETEENNNSEEDTKEHYTIDQPYDPHLDLRDYVIPSTDLLIDYDKKNKVVTETELLNNNRRIKETLKNYGIAITSIEATPGPTVTLYEIIPAPGVRISQIKNLADDIALSLAALGIRIIAPIPGKGAIGIEVPNSNPQVVSMKSMIESKEFQNSKAELPIVIGKTVENEIFITDLAKSPHLLVAGATGQGKSVGLNVIVTSLLYKKHPSELKFVFVDPKKVELSLYSNLERHYLAKIPDSDEAVITDVDLVEKTLRSLCVLMDTRYNLLRDAQCKKITEYNEKFLSRRIPMINGHDYMPYIVVVIDEFADLIMTAGKKIEEPICRLAQLARAVGIHLIIATQRPSVDIITGKIKANFPARAAFKTSSMVDSKTILDSPGAEQLIGRGDMLFSTGGKLTRLQCALIDTPEIESLVQAICEQQGYPSCFELPMPPKEGGSDKEDIGDVSKVEIDPLFEDAAICVVDTQHGSTSTIQRKFAIGYNRAGKIVDQLEVAGIVGPFRGSKPREVLVKSREQLEDIFSKVLGK
ncbi:MAG: DNA translocase FtsK 4TM domain-containing protein [Bacteroidota bacterium]|nr:DNA translocase FtsK 4TM domain-containing protein [Bacteroidota bacterium]